MGLFSSLNNGYSGLNVNQVALDVTSNNISNASDVNYTRQRTQIVSSNSIHTASGDIGMGAHVQSVVRIKDDYLFSRYEDSNKTLSYYTTLQKNLNEIATYFPDVQDVGMNKDIQNYFDAWNNFASNPTDNGTKVDLASKTQTLTNSIKQTRDKIDDLNKSANAQIKTYTDEVNSLAKQIADLNKQISQVEATPNDYANDLRDKRDTAEKRLIELTGAKVTKNNIKSMGEIDPNINDYDDEYNISLGGYPLVDNSTYHPIQIKQNPESKEGFYSIYFQKQDDSLTDITKDIPTESVIGGLLEFRGTTFDSNGEAVDGMSTKYINQLDAFSASLIQNTNSLYSYSAQEKAVTDQLFKPVSLTNEQIDLPLDSKSVSDSLKTPVRKGTLKLVTYDNNGNYKETTDSTTGQTNKSIDIDIDPTKSLQDNVDAINTKLKDNGVDYQAVIKNGNIAFEKSDTNSDGVLSNGALLVQEDGSLLFDALGDAQYKPISKANNDTLPLPIQNGSFDVVTYDSDGNELARRTIVVNSDSKDPLYSTMQGIASQINMPNVDDNNDNNSNDDVDDYYKASFTDGIFSLTQNTKETTFVGLDNDSANFGGAVGINKFFDGTNSKNISLNQKFIDNPSLINAYKAPAQGNNDVANDMVQLQYNQINFNTKDGESTTNTIAGYYRYMVSGVANDSDKINTNVDNSKALFNTIDKEYQSVSGVNLDEEMTNLMKYQNGYQASAKVITTISTMFDALMSIKT